MTYDASTTYPTAVAPRRGPVELWCPSLDRWVQGFELLRTEPDGHVVRRRSDGSVLPVRFPHGDVRDIGGAAG